MSLVKNIIIADQSYTSFPSYGNHLPLRHVETEVWEVAWRVSLFKGNPRIAKLVIGLSGIALLVVGAMLAAYAYLTPGNRGEGNPSYWPTKGWRYAEPKQVGMNATMLGEMKSRIAETGIDSVLVVKDGYLVLDEYYHDYRKEDLHEIFSATKSVVSALIGIAHDRGEYPSLDTEVLSLFTTRTVKNVDDWKRSLTLRDLLTLTSGFDVNEGMSVGPDYWRFLNSPDPTQFSLDLPMRREPGTYFYYASPDIHLATRVLAESTKTTPLDYAKRHLFGPLNITDSVWPTDPDGNNWGQTYLKLMPHDMAKIGYLYLNEGQWDGQQIISKEWVRESTTKHVNVTSSYGYGYYWWVDDDGFYYAMGAQGQYIFVVPDKNLVAVFTCTGFPSHYVPLDILSTFIIPSVV